MLVKRKSSLTKSVTPAAWFSHINFLSIRIYFTINRQFHECSVLRCSLYAVRKLHIGKNRKIESRAKESIWPHAFASIFTDLSMCACCLFLNMGLMHNAYMTFLGDLLDVRS